MNLFVTGTDTGIGKTVISTMLALKLGYHYWKPVQTGADAETDTQFVSRFIGADRVYKETYCLKQPSSPHQAAHQKNIKIELEQICKQQPPRDTVIEGAGGVFVPLNENELMIDVIARINCPVVVVARSTLGTINHTLLTLKALRSHSVKQIAVVMAGEHNPENRIAIEKYGRVKVIGEIPYLKNLSLRALKEASELIRTENFEWIT